MRTITRKELKQRLDKLEPITLIEALPQKHYDAGHLPGAVNMPHDMVHKLAERELPDRNATIIVYCSNIQCRNSHVAAQALGVMGYKNVYVYAGGKQDWESAGLPLERTLQDSITAKA